MRAVKAEREGTRSPARWRSAVDGHARRRDFRNVQAIRLFVDGFHPMKRTQSQIRRLVEPAVARISAALKKLATAASGHLGGDCYLHMELGRVLLADIGVASEPALGFAAWRVGAGDGDVISHAPYSQGHAPLGTKAYPYHAWLHCRGFVVDLTTYQLRVKARGLDAADGGHTTVTWCPDYLLLPLKAVKTYRQVAAAPHPGVAYYEARPELDAFLRTRSPPDPADLAVARLIIANPDVDVYGANTPLPDDDTFGSTT